MKLKMGRRDQTMDVSDREKYQLLKISEVQHDLNVEEAFLDLYRTNRKEADLLILKFQWLEIYANELYSKRSETKSKVS